MNAAATPKFECHLPERRRRHDIHMCHGSCCCCCCLHTVGGIIGSAVAPALGKKNRMPLNYYYDEEYDVTVPNVAKSGFSAVKLFWFLSLAAAILGVMLSAVSGRDGFIIGLIILALVYPAVQLLCAIITWLCLALSTRQDRSFQLWQVGKITLGLFLGAGAGVLVMVVIGVMMSRR